jgi:hypothetical protein
MLEALIGTTTETVFGCVLEQTDDDDKIRALLKDDPQRLTFQLALTRTYHYSEGLKTPPNSNGKPY